ncbi:hypothetical protein [Spiroplasma floricola]|uniref:MOLPALP family lipoprotein n=1 Tax=Spiroplasma floricola 23-6 TaxID=1336749 RepID=A0A2K8SE22_9MOLU|nr:hypothetical protein [Spiroplasma floricola]AUB31478.1 hypothetical protein SFLOR_v1c04260 [Spiroplasma floricola 23-6]
MKKILSLLGASLLTISPTVLLVSCSTNKVNFNENSVQTIVEQIGKSIYLSDTKNYDINYQMDEVIKTNRIKNLSRSFTDDENITQYSRFAELYNQYFDENMFSSDLQVQENINVLGNIQPKSLGFAETLLVTIPNLLGTLSDGKIIKFIFNSVLTLPQITNVLKNNYLVGYLDKILSQENTKLLSSAFSSDIYVGFTNQEVMNSAIMGFANSINYMLRETKVIEIPTKDNLTEEKFLESIVTLTKNLTSIRKKEKSIKLDLIRDLPAIAELIRFIRTLIIYTENGVKALSNSKNENYFDDISKYRKAEFNSVDNKFDILTTVNMLINTYNDGSGIRKILSVLFQSYKNPKIKVFITPRFGAIASEEIYSEGITSLLQVTLNSIFPTIVLNNKLIDNSMRALIEIPDKVVISSIICEFINIIISNNSLNDFLSAITYPGLSLIIGNDISDIMKNLSQNEKIKKGKIWDGIYSGDYINEFIKTFANKELSKTINIKNFLESKKIDILGTKLTIFEIFQKINETQVKGKIEVNFDRLSSLILDLRIILDLNNSIKNEEFEYKNFTNNIASLVEDLSGVKKLTLWLSQSSDNDLSIIENYKHQQANLKKEINDNILNLEVTNMKMIGKYSYEINFENKKYEINLKVIDKKKLQVKSIL